MGTKCTCGLNMIEPKQHVLSTVFVLLLLSCQRGVLGHLCNNYWMNMCDKYAVPSIHKRDVTIDTLPQTRGCRANMKRFMCQLIKHTCTDDEETVFLPPCRETCVRLYSQCLPPQAENAVSWSDFVRCNALPEANSRNCQLKFPSPARGNPTPVEPTELIPTNASKQNKNIKNIDHDYDDICECAADAGSPGVGRSVYFNKRFDYALKAKCTDVETIPSENSPTVIHIQVLQVLKQNRIQLGSGKRKLTLWSERGCYCSEVRVNKTYLFLGYENAETNQMLFNEDCIAAPWKKRWPEYIKKWEIRLRHDARKRERTRGSIKRAHGDSERDSVGESPSANMDMNNEQATVFDPSNAQNSLQRPQTRKRGRVDTQNKEND